MKNDVLMTKFVLYAISLLCA